MIERPDLNQVSPEVRAYIESLEKELERFRSRAASPSPRHFTTLSAEEPEIIDETSQIPLRLSEDPNPYFIVTISAAGLVKRTPRQLYQRQRRGGMGIFDLELPEEDIPTVLSMVLEPQSLILFTNRARAFRLPVSLIPEAPIRGKGQSLAVKFGLQPEERLIAALPDQTQGAIAMVSENGLVRYLRHHVFGEQMKPGTLMFDPGKFGPLAAVCRISGSDDLFIATRQGKAIRFSEKLVPPQGGPGIRLEAGDVPVAIAAVQDDSQVFLAEADGRGTLRLMASFAPNKSAGGGGKLAMKTNELVGGLTVASGADIFLISRLSKIIRFMADEVPPKDSVVQGVNCMALRADTVSALVCTQIYKQRRYGAAVFISVNIISRSPLPAFPGSRSP